MTRYKCWTSAGLCEAFTFLMENIYVQFEGMVYQQIVEIPMGTNCAPLTANLFLFWYEKEFMSNLHKSKHYDLIDMFNDNSLYIDDIFTIDNPEFDKHIPDIYPTELQLNKANTSDKETSFLDLNTSIKVIGSDVHTSIYDKRDDFSFPIVSFPWLSGDVPKLLSYGVYISLLIRFARCCASVSDFHSKNKSSNYFQTTNTGLQISQISKKKHLESSYGHTLTFCQNLVKYRFKNMFRKK